MKYQLTSHHPHFATHLIPDKWYISTFVLGFVFLFLPSVLLGANNCESLNDCIDFSVENITDNHDGTIDFCFNIKNHCKKALSNVAFQLPGVPAIGPANNSTYTAGKSYHIENTTNNPFYSIKFETIGEGIKFGQSDVFCYTLPTAVAYGQTSLQIQAKNGNNVTIVTLDISKCLLSGLGNRVWEDLNQDGLQDLDEPGIAGVTVKLYDCDDNFIAQKLTNSNGKYLFKDLIPESYYVVFSDLPDNYDFTSQDIGNGEWKDSDADINGKTACVDLDPGERYRKVDAGIVLGCEILDGGTVGPDRFGCGPYDPDPIYSTSLPDNGEGDFEYVWLYSLDPDLPFIMWVEEPNSNSPDYDPHFIDKTCWLVRGARRVGCTDITEVAYSNIVVAEVIPIPVVSFAVPGGECSSRDSISFTANPVVGINVSYTWTFANGSPASATGTVAKSYWASEGTYNVTLTIDNSGCSESLTQSIILDDCVGGGGTGEPPVCENVKTSGMIQGGDVSCVSPFDPAPLTNLSDPNPGNGTGPLEFVWLSSPDPDRPVNQWDIVPGGNGYDYDPGPITTSMYYLRCVRRAGCESFKESNVIKIEIVENAESLCKPTDFDVNEFTIELDLAEGTTTGRYSFSPDDRKFVAYTDGTAILTGKMIHTENSNRRWDATIWFESKSDYGLWTSGGGSYEMGNHDALRFTWDYYTIDASRSTLIGKNKFKNNTLNLASYSATDPFQVGEGANTQEDSKGAFGRFSYTGDYTGNGILKMGFEDCDDICAPEPLVAVQVLLEGSYDVADQSLSTQLNEDGILPLNQPFNVSPYNYAGTETVSTFPENIAQWTLVEVRSATDNSQVISRRACLIDKNGLLRDLDGVTLPEIVVPEGEECYLAVYAPGHLGAMCSAPVRKQGRVFNVDLCSSMSNAHTMSSRPGTPLTTLPGNRFGLWGGNAAGGSSVNSVDLQTVLSNLNTSGNSPADINCDGQVDQNDVNQTQGNYYRSDHIPTGN